jgi:tetrahydromethanopterin S-methyltransferase subunit G
MMEAMRQSWTDDRLDALNEKVDRRFDEVDRRFDEVDRRFSEVDRRLDNVEGEVKELRREMTAGFDLVHARFDSMQKTMFQSSVLVVAALLGIIATQL